MYFSKDIMKWIKRIEIGIYTLKTYIVHVLKCVYLKSQP